MTEWPRGSGDAKLGLTHESNRAGIVYGYCLRKLGGEGGGFAWLSRPEGAATNQR